MKRLLPEVGLLDPEIGSRRLQPLERQAMEYQTRVMNINQSNFYEAIRYFLNEIHFHYNKALVSHVNGCIIRLRAWTLNTSAKRCLCSNRRLRIWKALQEKQSWICKWWVHRYFKQVPLDFHISYKTIAIIWSNILLQSGTI